MRRRPRGTLFFVPTVYMRPPGTLVSFGRCVFRWPAQARARRHRRRPASPPNHSSPRVIGPRTSSSSPRRQNSSKSGPYESVCMQACKRARRCQWAVVNLGCVFSPFLPILVFGGENKPKKRQKELTVFVQEICAYTATADGAHSLRARHARSEDEVDTGPQRTEKQVSTDIELRNLRRLSNLLFRLFSPCASFSTSRSVVPSDVS